MIRSSRKPSLRSMLLASILIGAIGGAVNSYVALAQDEIALEGGVCHDYVKSEGTCYTFGCFSGQCEYYGPSCGHGPSCSSHPN